MDTFEAIEKRVSVRVYQDRQVDRCLIEKIIDAGRRAPSARAVEPWEFIAVTEKEKIHQLCQIVGANGRFIKQAPCCLVIVCEETKYYLEDGCAATENVLLAATALGLATCWIAGDKKPYAPEIARLLSIPVKYQLICLITLGWPAENKAQTKRRALNDVLHWEHF